jgi:uncharacterized iron-regulated membrane protein
MFPADVITSVSIDDDAPLVLVAMARSWTAFASNPAARHFITFDAFTGRIAPSPISPTSPAQRIVRTILRLHSDLFAGLPGAMLMAFMGLSLVAAILSGAILYGPFMRKLAFGTVRAGRSRRIAWLDLHNLLGIATLSWLLVVGVTGAMNELTAPLFGIWQRTDVTAAAAPWRGLPPVAQRDLSSIQSAFDTTQRALPDMIVVSALYPGGAFGSPHHYLLFTQGKTQLTSRLFKPVLIDAHTGALTDIVTMPWYLRALEIARPLHFGDYGGLPLKILWGLLDIVTIILLGSGLYLWIARRSRDRSTEPAL